MKLVSCLSGEGPTELARSYTMTDAGVTVLVTETAAGVMVDVY